MPTYNEERGVDPEVELLHLSVGSESLAARGPYESMGFHVCGVEPRPIKLDDRYLDVEMMVLSVHNAV